MGKKLYRSRTDKMLGGICGGLGKFINLDPTIIRVLVAVATFATGIVPGLILYVILQVIIPEEPDETAWQPPQYQPPYDAPPPAQGGDGGDTPSGGVQ